MLFNSFHFLIFFPIVILLYFSLPHKKRWILLLIASYYFYMSEKAEYGLLLLSITLVNYFAAIRIGKLEAQEKRKKYLILSIIFSLGLLFGFKYVNFFNDIFQALFDNLGLSLNIPYANILLPVGISFYTFQAIGYSIDVYRKKISPEKHFGIFAVYIAFFPQLVAGPIERASNLIPQFFRNHDLDYKRITSGLKIMLWGFFLKIVIADRLAIFVNEVYNNAINYTGWPLIFATYAFSFQIYCDFAGYSFIAIGAAKIMGINLMDNFRRPYHSSSIIDFWRRWHISLSTWFRDYVYVPLGGNKVKRRIWAVNIVIVFLLSGLWHGAGLTFIVWALLHAFYFIIYSATSNIREKISYITGIIKYPKIHKMLKILITFNLVTFAWIFFRANNLSDAQYIVTHLFSGLNLGILDSLRRSVEVTAIGFSGLLVSFFLIAFMEFVHAIQSQVTIREFLLNKPLLMRWTMYYILILGILLFGVFDATKFIYFQF